MNNKIKLGLLVGLLVVPYRQSRAFEFPSIVVVAVATTAAVVSYKLAPYLYNQCKEYVADKIADASADAIVVAFTPKFKIPADQLDQVMHKKAQLICMRKRVLLNLDRKLNTELPTISAEHRKALEANLKHANFVFGLIDKVRAENPFEKEYAIATRVEEIIENNIVNSMILEAKPTAECTPEEITKKQAMAKQRAKTLSKVKDKIAHTWLQHFEKTTWLLDLLSL